MAQLVEQLLPTTENPLIQPSAIVINHLFIVNCLNKTKSKEKGREWHIFNYNLLGRIPDWSKYRICDRSIISTLKSQNLKFFK